MNYLADYQAAQDAGHHADCDGFMFVHRVTIEVNGETWRAICEECGPLHAGSYGQEVDFRRHKGHTREVACDFRCLKWDEGAA